MIPAHGVASVAVAVAVAVAVDVAVDDIVDDAVADVDIHANDADVDFDVGQGLGLEVVSQEEAAATAANVIGVAYTKPYVARTIHWQV